MVCALVVAGLAVVGCGGSSTQSPPATVTVTGAQSPSSPGSTGSAPKQSGARSGRPPAVSIQLSVVGLGPGPSFALPKAYTCDGADTSPAVQWSAVPHGTAELALFIVNLTPINGAAFFDWAVAGLSPSSHGISAGALPAGAVAGTNSFGKLGYSICPAKGTGESYIARLVALPRPLAAKPGFDAQTFFAEAERAAKVVGVSGAGGYTRP